ncbi:MAG: hypothetical protein H7281_13115 [Bacteriovorax sp.]|nr:hypothetical protein [Bacteriovorax sp.]
MKFIIIFSLAILSLSAFAETITSDCTFNSKYKTSAVLKESLSENGKYILVELDASVQNLGSEFPWSDVIMIKNLDGTIASFQGDNSSQTIEGQKTIYKKAPTNEKYKAEVTLESDNKTIKKVKVYQKIYNGVADLLLPLNVNRMNCEF